MPSPTEQVAILGAGPAGMSCANVLLSFGLRPVVIERSDHVGGIQRTNFHPNLWMLGLPGETGQEITARLARHYFDLGLPTFLGCELVSLARSAAGFVLRLGTAPQAQDLEVAALVLATGMRPYATPELTALAEGSPRVIIGPLSEVIRDDIRDSRVLILGGGDNALDHALFLAERGNRVTVCTRRAFAARHQFIDACRGHAEIELRPNCTARHLAAGPTGVTAEWSAGRDTYDWLLVMYGYRPNTDVLERFPTELRPRLTASGHIQVDNRQCTSVPGIYAAGDVTENLQPSVATAIAQGLAAARAIEQSFLPTEPGQV